MGNWEFQMLQRLLLSIDKHVESKTTSLGETNDFDVPEHHSAPLLHTKSFWNFIVNMPPCVVFVSPGLFLVAILKLCLLSKLQRLK